jgi:hypothetical protein
MDVERLQLILPFVAVILQTITCLAIAGGFVFAAISFRQSRQATVVANFTKLVELQMHLRQMRVDDPRLAAVYKHDVEGFVNDGEVRQYFFNLMQLSLFEIAWFSYKHGQITEDYYQSWLTRMRVIQKEESFRRMMRNPAMKIFHDEFQQFVEQMMRDDASEQNARFPNRN